MASTRFSICAMRSVDFVGTALAQAAASVSAALVEAARNSFNLAFWASVGRTAASIWLLRHSAIPALRGLHMKPSPLAPIIPGPIIIPGPHP